MKTFDVFDREDWIAYIVITCMSIGIHSIFLYLPIKWYTIVLIFVGVQIWLTFAFLNWCTYYYIRAQNRRIENKEWYDD